MKYKAFTIVELVVVVTILGVLSTVAFISYIGYAENGRDAARISNLTKLETTLELRKTRAGEYPKPDESSDITYLGKTIWTQGIMGSKTKKLLKFQVDGMDPKYETDYSYSVTYDGDRFEIGTIMENGENNTLGFLLGKASAAGEDKALNYGNFKGKFYKTKVNGETHVFSLPGLILKDKNNFELKVDVATDRFSITGGSALPESYVGVTDSDSTATTSFTPRLLYRGANCGVETDQEIVNFIATLRDSFNSEPYLSSSKYANIFKDFDNLKSNIDNFDKLKELGTKINESLGCNIRQFKTTDIFPTQCGYEGLDFEGVADGFDIAGKPSCLFSYEGNGNATVKENVGIGLSKALNINPGGGSGELKYRVFTYKPTKFEFSIKSTLLQGSSYIEFYINGNRYIRKEAGNDYNLGYEKFTTSLLPSGLYDFKWKIFKNNSYNTQLWLDDLSFTCVGGGTGCGWTLGFEPGDENPNEMFTFEGDVKIPWILTTDATEGNIGIVNPLIPTSGNTSITYTKILNKKGRLSFDYKIWDHHDGWVRLYIDGIEYKQWGWGTKGDPLQTTYGTYITAPLSPGKHTIKLTVYRNWHPTHKTFLYLDNFQTYCVEGDAGCGMDLSFENSNTPTKGYFTFDGETTTPWGLESEPVNVSNGQYSMRSPSIPNSSKSYMYYHKDFDEPAKISFDYKLEQSGSWAKLYIDDIEYDYIGYGGRNPGIGFNTFTTPLLNGKHTIKIEIFRNWNSGMWGNYIYLYLDNFKLSCLGGIGLPGNELCGINEKMEPSDIDFFTFSGIMNTPWMVENITGNFTEGTQSLKIQKIGKYDTSSMVFKKTVLSGQELKFDMSLYQSRWSKVTFYVDNNPLYIWDRTNSISTFNTYTSGPLNGGEHEFKFLVEGNNPAYPRRLYIDNVRVE